MSLTPEEHARRAAQAAAMGPEAPPAPPARQPDPGLLQDATVHAVLAWRSDSIMLARLRPVFADLIADSQGLTCEAGWTTSALTTCRTGNLGQVPRHEWCRACILHDLAARLERVTLP